MQNAENQNKVNLRYNYSGYSVNDQNFFDYNQNIPIEIKKILIFIHYYDDNHNNEQCFSSNPFVDNEKSIPNVEWLIINDCNIPSSSMIFPAVKNFKNLIGLDLSFNNICNISAIAHLIKSPKLMYLDLSHNPLEFQEDLKEVILKINPHISVINRKRVTPTDFYNIINKNPDFLNNKGNRNNMSDNNENNFNLNNIQTFRRCQLFSAIRSIQKDRIYPLTAEIDDIYIDDSFNLKANYIDTSKIQAIDLSNCDLIYFDFTMFKEAFFIDISNNHIKSDHNLKLSRENNPNLLYLNISGNDFKNYDLLKVKFPNCNIIPHHSEANEKYEISNISKTVDIHSHIIQNFQELLDNFQEFGIKKRKNNSEIIICLRNINSNIKFVEIVNNDLYNVNQNEDNYKINFISFKETLNSINMKNSDEIIFDERVQKLSIHTADENNLIIDRKLSKNLSLWFISYLNLNSFSIEAKDFHIILTNCLNLRKLTVKFIDIHETISDNNQTISDYYFQDIEKSVLLYLTDLDIILSNYSFDSKKQYNKFIKKIAYFRSLKNFCITDYTNKYSENDEIDTTFKYLRGLNTFNGYRNLMPPTPSQYCALNAFITNDHNNDNDNDIFIDNDDNNNDDNNNNNNENINNGNNEYSFNLNNMQYFKLYENDLNHTSGKHRWLQALPIRSMDIFENNKENKKVENVKKVINDKSAFFDQFPRLRYVNGMRIKRDLPTKSREESLDENKAFESWTSKLDKAFELLYQIQFFIVYSFSVSSSFVSKFLYFLYSTWIILERFFIKHHITLSTDFTSTYERIFVYSIAPLFALILLLWEPSYEDFTTIAKNKKKSIGKLLLVELLGALFISICSFLDSKYVEHEFVFFPYMVQFFLFSFLIFLITLYYYKHIQMELVEEYKEEFDQQSKNSFIGYLEFKFLKSKVAYSILSILILPICGLLFESKFQNTFVDYYKLFFTGFIIIYVFYMLFSSTNDDTAKIIDYLDLEKNKEESSNDIELEEIRENENKYKTHYLVTKSKDDDNEKWCSLSKFNQIFGGAFHWRLTADDFKYQSFAAEFRTPTQIFYSQYRYRGLQKFYGLIEVFQRVLTELINFSCPRFLFIVPVLFTIYVALWWPNYDNITNISTIVTSVGKILMSLFNFLFDSFGIENKRAESILTYMNIIGIVLNVFGIFVSSLYSFCQIYIESREKRRVYKPDKFNINDIKYKDDLNQPLNNDDDDDSL